MTDQIQQATVRPGGEAGANAAPVIELIDVYKSFGRLEVLRGVDLVLHPRETTVIIGESGVGKSVVLKHIVGLLRPDRGEVRYHGRSIGEMNAGELARLRMNFGFLFQLGALFDSLTVAENVGFPLVEQGRRSRAEIERVVTEKLRMVGLDGIQSKRPADLSGGQRKRVALARAIALDPEIILYDEPTTGLDPVRADVINELILKLRREIDATGIVVTHDMASANKVADRILMLHEGKFIFDGTSREIAEAGDERIRRFIEGRASEKDLRSLRQES
ncbi:MAG TPA: ABC transporter ATP-binding protein [Phycisphaerae bacterium]|nr:ABC transporter ATP-binding protein [Phycisphaerae bacterium]